MPKKKRGERKRGTGYSLDPKLIERLKRVAKADNRSASYFAEQAIREFLERAEGAA